MSLKKLKFQKGLDEGIGPGSVKLVRGRDATKLIDAGKAELAGLEDELKIVPWEEKKVKSKAKIAEENREKKAAKNKSDDDKESKQNRAVKQKQKDDARKKGAELRKAKANN